MRGSAWGVSGEKTRVLAKFAWRIGEAPVAHRRDEVVRVREEMLVILSNASEDTIVNCFKHLRKAINKGYP